MSTFSLEDKAIKFNTADDILPFLPIAKDVTEIRLSGNTFGVDASIELAKHLQDKEQLTTAQMADIFTGRLREEIPAALEALLPALQSCKNLRTINLCDNAFGPTAATPLEAFLKAGPFHHLHLQNNGMGPEAGSRMALALSRNTTPLETIICGRNRLENGSAEAWVACFEAHKESLKTVKLPQNGIRPEGIKVMLGGLSKCVHLETVDFQDNTFTTSGANALADALVNWPDLQELAVGDCLLGRSSLFTTLAKGLNKKIRILRLQYNEIDSAGLKALVKAIETGLPDLEILELNGNKFAEEDESIEAINAIFEERGKGALDDLDDLEDDDDDDDEDEDDDKEVEESDKHEPEANALDAMIEKNLAQAIAGLST